MHALKAARAGRLVGLAFGLAWLAGCATPKLRPEAALLAAQEQRERTLAARPDWSLSGRLAVSTPDERAAARSVVAAGDRYRFTVHAPVWRPDRAMPAG